MASRASGVPTGGTGDAGGGRTTCWSGRFTGRCRARRLAAFPALRGIGPSSVWGHWPDAARSGVRASGAPIIPPPMTDLDRLLAENLTVAFGLLALLMAILLILIVLQTSRLRRAVKSYRDLVRDDRDGG